MHKVVLTVPMLQVKSKDRKYKGKMVTRGFYVNIPKATVESMGFEEKVPDRSNFKKSKVRCTV